LKHIAIASAVEEDDDDQLGYELSSGGEMDEDDDGYRSNANKYYSGTSPKMTQDQKHHKTDGTLFSGVNASAAALNQKPNKSMGAKPIPSPYVVQNAPTEIVLVSPRMPHRPTGNAPAQSKLPVRIATHKASIDLTAYEPSDSESAPTVRANRQDHKHQSPIKSGGFNNNNGYYDQHNGHGNLDSHRSINTDNDQSTALPSVRDLLQASPTDRHSNQQYHTDSRSNGSALQLYEQTVKRNIPAKVVTGPPPQPQKVFPSRQEIKPQKQSANHVPNRYFLDLVYESCLYS
jgi:hypothetical protein